MPKFSLVCVRRMRDLGLIDLCKRREPSYAELDKAIKKWEKYTYENMNKNEEIKIFNTVINPQEERHLCTLLRLAFNDGLKNLNKRLSGLHE